MTSDPHIHRDSLSRTTRTAPARHNDRDAVVAQAERAGRVGWLAGWGGWQGGVAGRVGWRAW